MNIPTEKSAAELISYFITELVDERIEARAKKIEQSMPTLTSGKSNLRHAKVDDIYGLGIKFLSFGSCRTIMELVKEGKFDEYGMDAFRGAYNVGPEKKKQLMKYFYYE